MARQKIKEFYAPEELTPELLDGLVDETELRPRQILSLVDPIAHDSEEIWIDVMIQQTDRHANIVGFSDSSIATKGLETERKHVSPFHVKNYREYKVTDSKFVQRSGGNFTISAAGLRASTSYLEDLRLNLVHWAVLAMINDRQFTYQDGDTLLTVPFTEEIGILTPPGTKLDAANAALGETNAMKSEYFRKTGQVPNVGIMSSATGRKFADIDEVKAAYVALQSRDPENSGQLFERFTWNGITWIMLHEQYPDLDGGLRDPIDSGRIVITVDNVIDPDPDAAGSPFKLHRAATPLNGEDSSGPFYDVFEVSKDPESWGHRLYDNFIPGVAKRNVVMHWEAITA